MSTQDLDAFFDPGSIALVGASDRPGSIGAVLAANLLAGGFAGPVMLVNPRHARIAGSDCYPDLGHLPTRADLGVVCTPPAAVPAVIAALGQQGARAAVVVTAGFAEAREARGGALQQELLQTARAHGMRILGPNCVGLLIPGIGLNASFAHRAALPGNLGFVSQSGAVITSVLDWAEAHGIGFSAMISLGDMADVDFADTLDILAADTGTRAILLYMESLGDAHRFMSAARAAARVKPVVAVKAGRHAEGARAVASHTGALAGSDAVCQAAFDRAGILRVLTLAELFDAAEILALAGPLRGERLAILTNGGGNGVLATDALIEEGGRLAELAESTLDALDRILPRTWSHGNPVDLIGDAGGQRYRDALAILCQDPGVDAILAMHSPTAVVPAVEAAEAVVATAHGEGHPLLLTSWVGNGAMRASHRLFETHGIPSYPTPEQAVHAFQYLVRYRRAQVLLGETDLAVDESQALDTGLIARLVESALAEGRTALTEPEAKRVLAACGIPVVATRAVGTPEEAATAAAEIGAPVVVKILSPDLGHKSDVGGVVLDLNGPAAVLEAARGMLARIRFAHPEARLQGLAVQPMVRRPGAQELIVGAARDPQLGPVILVGQGGIAVEAIADHAIGLPPLNLRLAHELIERTRIYRVLRGVRGQPPADLDSLALTLVRISRLVSAVPQISELDINPLLIDQAGVMALDARIALTATPAAPPAIVCDPAC